LQRKSFLPPGGKKIEAESLVFGAPAPKMRTYFLNLLTVVKAASFVGYIRWFNEKNDYKIVFDGLFYKPDCGDDREQLLLDQLNEQSSDKKETLTKEMINDFITTYKTDDIFNLCNGHDVTALLVKAFTINSKQLATALRLSFHQEQFIRTALYRKLLAWQTRQGIAVLYSLPEEAANG
jgi:hypothetical protein